MKDRERKIKFGFISIPKNTILIHENFLTGKVTAISPGLKFVFGYVKNQDMSIKSKKISDISVYDINNNRLLFDITVFYRIASGTHYRDFECKDYYKFLETCVMEEKSNERQDWLCEFNNKISYHGESFFKRNFKKIHKRGLKRWWRENHPAIQHEKFEKSIIEDENFLSSDLQSTLTDSLFDEDINKLTDSSTGGIVYKKIFFSLKKKIAIKGFELVDLNIENIRIRQPYQPQEIIYNYEKNIKDDLIDIQIKKADNNSVDNNDDQFVIEYEPLTDKSKIIKKEKNIDDYLLSENNSNKLWEQYNQYIESGNFVIDEKQEKYIVKELKQIDAFSLEKNTCLEEIEEVKENLVEEIEEINETSVDEAEEVKENLVEEIEEVKENLVEEIEEINETSVDEAEEVKETSVEEIEEVKENPVVEEVFDEELFEEIVDNFDLEYMMEVEKYLEDSMIDIISEELYQDYEVETEEPKKFLMLGNNAIEVKSISQKPFVIDIPSFVNNNLSEKVKVLNK